jgi:GT2 family glycosyltransferase
VIPTWNRRELLADVLADLARQDAGAPEVIVVDNGSTDGAADLATRAGARVIRFDSNRGFASAVNAAIRAAETSWVAILNNDVRLEPDWLRTLLAAGEPESAWFVTGRILSASNPRILDGTFDLFCRGGLAWRAGSGRADSAEWQQPRPIAIAPMTAAIFRRELFDRVGLLDETFGSYLEDVDFGLRCAALDLRGWYEPRAVARHVGSATFGAWKPDTVRLLARNQVLLERKHLAGEGGWPAKAAQLLWALLAARHFCWGDWKQGRQDGRRAASAIPAGRVPARVLLDLEKEIFALQQQSGWDTLWRLYFLLVGQS